MCNHFISLKLNGVFFCAGIIVILITSECVKGLEMVQHSDFSALVLDMFTLVVAIGFCVLQVILESLFSFLLEQKLTKLRRREEMGCKTLS